jgi:multidrug efflux system membrane fusion protein
MKIMSAGVVCLIAAALMTGMAGCGDKGKKGTVAEGRPVVRGLTLETAASTTVPERVEATGTVRSINSALLSARIPGTISGIYAKEGDRVRRGKLLLTIEALESSAGASGAAYAVEEAQSAVEEALARKKLADVTFERFSKLFNEQAVTRQELDTRLAERDVADKALARARARLDQMRESHRAAGAVAGYTRIAAPFGGIITGKTVDVGATVFPGMPLMTVEAEGNYRLEVNAPESLLGKIRVGQAVPVSLDGVTGSADGKVAEIVPRVDPTSRTFTVKLDISPKGVRSGQFGRARFPVGEKRRILVPESALSEHGELTSVWVVDRLNIVRLRLVKPGSTYGNRIEILAGLSDGDRIVTGGVEKVTDGARIE